MIAEKAADMIKASRKLDRDAVHVIVPEPLTAEAV
jgi:hypothetical protein